MKRGAWISAGAALLVGLLAIWMFSSMERVQERVWIGYRGEARDNPWLAAERLLERMGRPSARARSVPQLKALPADGMLVLPRRTLFIDDLTANVEGARAATDLLLPAITEADPVVKGQTASSSYKPAILENGVRIMVPPHIESGTRVIVRTEDSTYIERAKG